MIPIRLLIQGLYSYQEAQEIDFTRLTEAGLFGIFGPVGSGKSSLLEAMTFALYGETERLGQNDSRTYNMMNLKSREMKIEFEFRAGEGDGERYLFTAEVKRQKKNFDRFGPLRRRAAKWDGTDWTPLESNDADRILNLSYDHFRRTIIIPQGKFQEFLQLSEGKRTEMMMDIFQLQRFNLAGRVGSLRRRNDMEIQNIMGQLKVLGEASENEIKNLEDQQAALEERAKTADAEIEKFMASEKAMEELRRLIEQRDAQKRHVETLDRRAPEFEQREAALKNYETCHRHFADLIERMDEAQVEAKSLREDLAAKRERAESLNAEIALQEQKFQSAQQEHGQREDRSMRIEDLRRVLTIRDLARQLQTIGDDVDKGEAAMRTTTDEIARIETARKDTDAELEQARAERPDRDRLEQMRAWHQDQHYLAEQVDTARQIEKQAAAEAERIARRTTDLAKEAIALDLPAISPATPLAALTTAVASQSAALERDIAALRSQRDHEVAMARLGEYAAGLKDGEPCPLCGATNHPRIYDASAASDNLAALEAQIQAHLDHLSSLRELDKNLNRLKAEQETSEKQCHDAAAKLQAAQIKADEHGKTWAWGEMRDSDSINQAFDQARRLDDLIKSLEDRRAKIERDLSKARSASERAREALHAAQNAQREILAQQNILTRQLKHLTLNDLAETKDDALRGQIEELITAMEQASRDHEALGQSLQKLREERAGLIKGIEAAEAALVKADQALARDRQRMEKRLADADFDDLEQVKAVLNKPMDVEAERTAILNFHKQRHSEREKLKDLEKQAASQSYDSARHARIKDDIAARKSEAQSLRAKAAELKSQAVRMKRDWDKRQTLERELKRLQDRQADIRTLRLLFRNNGFVNFVSSVFLDQLCRSANDRFRRLTAEQLRLELGAGGFQVRDYLNNGQSRSVKTLSGGQTFQAALSLALALADHIQSLNQARQNFFFMDEGFGTLDRRSLQTVFDTLKALRRENRIVGVISHVDEMQQEIDAHLRIRLDPARGSLVETSWGDLPTP